MSVSAAANQENAGWKKKAVRELTEYLMNAAYLIFFFGAFVWYKRLVLAQHQISYVHYGIVIIKALILAKVILIGDLVGLGRRLEDRPLIYPTLYKAAVFTVWAGLFSILEETVIGLLERKGWVAGFDELRRRGAYGMLAECLVTFVAFIPFFAFRELERVLGEGRLHKLFFRPGIAVESTRPSDPSQSK
jgi:hypothetical protein